MSRWVPEIRSVERIEFPSVSSDRQSTARSMSRRMVPSGRAGMIPNVFRHPRHFRRALPSLSRPQPIVGSPQVRQAVGLRMEAGAVMASLICLYCRPNNPTYQARRWEFRSLDL